MELAISSEVMKIEKHHLESRNYILNVRDISRNNDNADDKLNENLVMEMKRCLILYDALKSAIYLLSWSC